MKNLCLVIFGLLTPCLLWSQQRSEFLSEMNNAIENKKEVMKLLEKTGIVEHREMGGIYRFKLEDIASIKEKVVEQNFIINVYCNDGNCFTIYRNDSVGTQVNNNAYFFSSAEHAFIFAKNLALLSNSYKTNGEKVILEVVNEQSGGNKTETSTTKTKDGLDDYLDSQTDKEDANPSKKQNPNVAKKEDDDEDADIDRSSSKALEAKEHMEDIKANREEKKQQRKDEFDEKREQLKAEQEVQREKQREELAAKKEQRAPAKTTRRSTQKEEDTEAVGGLASEDEKETNANDKKNDALCKPLDMILKSAISSDFKSIEGAETNTLKHINESKVRWKGARKSYVTNYKGKRAFIAEIKSSKDFELLQIEYDELQTELEKCLGDEWDFTDKSNDEEYADFIGEIRDTEYHNGATNGPKLRIILISDNDKYTLFVRIQ